MARKSADATPGNIAQLTRLLNLGVQQCYNLVNSGIIPASDNGVFDLAACAHGYIKYLQGRSGDERRDFMQEKMRESRLKGDLLQLQIQEKSGTLVQADAVEQAWINLVVAARSELMLLSNKITYEIKALYDIDIDHDLISSLINEALNRLADSEPEDPEDRGETAAELDSS